MQLNILTISTVFVVFALNSTFTVGAPKTHFGRCKSPNGRGVCIKHEDCKDLDALVQSIFGDQHLCTATVRDLVCCPVESSKPPVKLVELLKAPACGRRLSTRITLGEDTQFDEFPWMALLIYSNGLVNLNLCGGVLVSDRHVLTAAHCISIDDKHPDYKLDTVRLGEWDVTSEKDCFADVRGFEECAEPFLDVKVRSTKLHPNYQNQRYQTNDIALVSLSKSVTFTRYIRPICLPDSFKVNDNYVGRAMEISGWGFDEHGSQTSRLMKAVMELWSSEHCTTVNAKLNSQQLCASGRRIGSSSCNGDSGGPLMVDVNGVYYTIGVISMGMTNCTTDIPVIFSKIDEYIDWIRQEISTESTQEDHGIIIR